MMPWRLRRRAAELDEEIASHFRLALAEREARGEDRAAAEQEVRREFGNVVLVKEATREVLGWSSWERLVQDVRHGTRLLQRSKGFAATSMFCIALGVAATITIFAALNGLLLAPLPYEGADRLAVVHTENVKRDAADNGFISWADFVSWRAGAHAFAEFGVWSTTLAEFAGPERESERLVGAQVSPGALPAFGLKPLLGRAFTDQDQQFGNHFKVILSYGLWQRRYGEDPGIIGRMIQIGAAPPERTRPYEVVGVLAPGTSFPEAAEFWRPLQVDADEFDQHGARRIEGAVGRLARGASLAAARAEIRAISRRLAATFPQDNAGWEARVTTLREELVGSLEEPVLLFQGAALLVLLIASANVANLLLARAPLRRRELAVRGAIGAGRARLVRLLVIESLVLAMAGGAIGVLLAAGAVRLLPVTFPVEVPAHVRFSIDPTVLLCALLVSLATGLLFGVAPALRASRVAPGDVLREGRHAGGGPDRRRLRSVLIVLEIAASVVLAIGATLLIRSNRAIRDELGYERRGTLILRIPTPADPYEGAPREIFLQQLGARLRALPGVASVGWAGTGAPLEREGPARRSLIQIAGAGSAPETGSAAIVHEVSPDYLSTLGVPIVRGRSFVPADRPSDPHATGLAAIVNESFARQYFRERDPLGQLVITTLPGAENLGARTFRIVGVARNFRQERPPRLIAPALYVYAPFGQNNNPIVVRTALKDPLELVPQVHEILAQLDPTLRIAGAHSFETTLSRALWRERIHQRVLISFAGLALVMAMVGIYGVIASIVAQRTREFGVRIALGATSAQLMGWVARQSIAHTALGISLGLAAALLLTRLIASLLYQLAPTDAATFLAVAAVLALIAFLAGLMPARRAAMVAPLAALRED
jgi:putative ABC transport system permease protein